MPVPLQIIAFVINKVETFKPSFAINHIVIYILNAPVVLWHRLMPPKILEALLHNLSIFSVGLHKPIVGPGLFSVSSYVSCHVVVRIHI
jgi:hypothetical protein